MDGADALDEAAHARCNAAGQALFWRKHTRSTRSPPNSRSLRSAAPASGN
jgi:hypothetical protein